MRWTNTMIIGLLVLSSCHREQTYFDTQTQFAEDLNYRLGKWYSVTDSGTTSQSRNTNLDTIWFINDTLAGWTGFGGNPYSFFKTYISPKSIYNMVYIAPDQITTGKMDTCVHQFGFSGDTLTLFWNFTTSPPQVERYVKKIN